MDAVTLVVVLAGAAALTYCIMLLVEVVDR